MDLTGDNKSRQRYAAAFDSVVNAGELLCEELSGTEARKAAAMQQLEREIASWEQAGRELIQQSQSSDPDFLYGSSDILSGQLLIEAASAIDTQDAAAFGRTLSVLAVRKKEFTTNDGLVLRFEKDLLTAPSIQGTAEEILRDFKKRANRTLENMVSESREVITIGIDHLKSTFEKFSGELKTLAESFASKEAASFFKAGADKVIAGLRKLAEYLSQPRAQEAMNSVKEAIHLDMKSALRKVFRCDETSRKIEELAAGPDMSAEAITEARVELAATASNYVTRLAYSRWAMTAIGAVGGLLVLTGVGGPHMALATPVAYGIVTVATIVIGMEYTGPKINQLIAKL